MAHWLADYVIGARVVSKLMFAHGLLTRWTLTGQGRDKVLVGGGYLGSVGSLSDLSDVHVIGHVTPHRPPCRYLLMAIEP